MAEPWAFETPCRAVQISRHKRSITAAGLTAKGNRRKSFGESHWGRRGTSESTLLLALSGRALIVWSSRATRGCRGSHWLRLDMAECGCLPLAAASWARGIARSRPEKIKGGSRPVALNCGGRQRLCSGGSGRRKWHGATSAYPGHGDAGAAIATGSQSTGGSDRGGRPNQHSALEAVAKGGGCGEALLPMVELARGSPVLSIASSAKYLAPRPLCRLTLPPLQVPLAPQSPLAPVKPLAPPPTARRSQLRQNCQHHCGPGPASITSVSSRPAAA